MALSLRLAGALALVSACAISAGCTKLWSEPNPKDLAAHSDSALMAIFEERRGDFDTLTRLLAKHPEIRGIFPNGQIGGPESAGSPVRLEKTLPPADVADLTGVVLRLHALRIGHHFGPYSDRPAIIAVQRIWDDSKGFVQLGVPPDPRWVYHEDLELVAAGPSAPEATIYRPLGDRWYIYRYSEEQRRRALRD